MSQSAGLLKSTLIYSIGNLGSKVLAFALVPLYSVYLSKAELGIYDLLIVSVSLLTPLITFQVGDAAYRWLLEAKEKKERAISAVTNSIFILAVAGLAFGFACILFSVFFHFSYLFYTVLYVLLNILTVYFQQVVRGLGNNKLYAVAGIVNTFLMVALTLIFFIVFESGINLILLAGIISNFVTVVGLFFLGKINQYVDIDKLSRKEAVSMIQYSWPLIPNAISWWLISEVNRFIILYFLGVEANGVFAVSTRFPSILVMINSIFMLSWQDLSIAADGTDDKNSVAYSRIFNTYMVFELTMVVMLIAISKYVVQTLIDPKFLDSWRYMPLLYLSVAFASFSSFLGAAYLGAKKTKSIFVTTMVGSMVNLAISLLLIRHIGLFAPASGTFAGYCTMWLIRLYETRKFFTIKINFRLLVSLLVLSFIIMQLVFAESLYADIIAISLAAAFLIVLNMPLMKFIWKQLLHNYLTRLRSRESA